MHAARHAKAAAKAKAGFEDFADELAHLARTILPTVIAWFSSLFSPHYAAELP